MFDGQGKKCAELLLNKMEDADAILIGAASGMSAAAGHTFYYERDPIFVELFGKFEEKYGFHNGFDGFYYPYRTREEFWAFVSTLICHIYEAKAGKPYEDLYELVRDKNYHVLTTNQDTLFEQICPPGKISAIQGDWRYFQCRSRCHDGLYPHMQGSLPARQVSMRIGLDESSNAVTVNQNCASGMRALEIVCNDIQLGKTEIGLVIGTENMTQAPFMLPKARMGYRMGDIPTDGTAELYDSLIHDALYDELVPGHMGLTADNVAKLCGISRKECDDVAVQSHNRACAAIDAGKFKDEIIPVVVPDKRKGDIVIDTDEHPIRDCSYDVLSKMKPVFSKDGVTTAANASGINDAAAAVIVMSEDKAKELGIKPMAKMLNICGAGVEPKYMGIGPAYAIPKCLKGADILFENVDYWEINEAFSAQFLGVARKLEEEHGWKLNMDKVNRNGSGIALGHPIGCTGLRIIVSMLYEMERNGDKIGCASLCVGGGPAMASLWSRDI